MADVERTAKAILLRAQSQAEQLLAAAQTEAETLKEQATKQGLAEGRRDGTAQGLMQGKQAGHQQALTEFRAQFERALAAVTAAANSLEQGRNELEAAGLVEVVQLALAIARRVTKRQGMIDPQVLAANLGEAMKLAVKSADIRVAIHPSQRATLDAALPQLKLQWPNLNHVQVIEDDQLQLGGCRVFTQHGQISADLDEQLARIAGELLPA
ncbi:MAG TPA: FliH/SctL family protein [Tepidisphaeraceae bacterium]|nr:FliH/SctL family protein [Tepidisphaeraceae bacterium]